MLLLDLQSMVDVITNSSTEIYVSCTNDTIKYVKNILNSVFKQNTDDILYVDIIDLYELTRLIECYFDDNSISDFKLKELYCIKNTAEIEKYLGNVKQRCPDIDLDEYIKRAINATRGIYCEGTSILIRFKTPELEKKYKKYKTIMCDLCNLAHSFEISERSC